MLRNALSKIMFPVILVLVCNFQAWTQTKLEFEKWTDPTESAFSLDVPVNWKISGGIKRASDTRAEITMQSPDNQTIVKIGDVNISLSYVEPNSTLASLGYREGQMASATLQIRRFMNGAQFAEAYIRSAISQRCSNLKVVSKENREDYVDALAKRGLVPGFANDYTAGEVILTCQSGGQTYVAYAFAETYKVVYQGTANAWNLRTLYAFLAPADLGAVTDKVVQRGVSTLEQDKQWLIGERQYEQKAYENIRNYRQFSSKLQQETTNARVELMDKIAQQRRDIL